MEEDKVTFINMAKEDYPDYLKSYDALAQYFRAQLANLNTVDKGDRFAHAVAKLVPQTDAGMEFDLPNLNKKKSRDKGVDIIATNKSGNNLYIQSKLWLDRSEDLDSVLSKFQSYQTEQIPQGHLFPDDERLNDSFMLVTLSSLNNVIAQYKKQNFSSKDFYKQKLADGALHFVDGPQIYTILRASYSKTNKINTTFSLNFEDNLIHKDNVYIGIISSTSLKELYKHMGDALFFENVRDFLGVNVQERSGRKTPNTEIIKTITSEADKMLSRNNGIVFSASQVELGNNPRQLILHNGSVVNGCQTTMCIVEYAKQDCHVLVKIVEIDKSWDIATSANYQNSVADIDLELAQYLRPQLAKRAAALSGVRIDRLEKSPFQIIEEIYDRKVTYAETRLIYIGIFSRSPKNIFVGSYDELLQDILKRFYEKDEHGEKIFDLLYTLQLASQEALDRAEKTFKDQAYSKIFERIHKEENISYRCFVSVLALCGLVNIDISEHQNDALQEYNRMNLFFSDAQDKLQDNRGKFLQYYALAIKLWMHEMNIDTDNVKEIQQIINRKSRSINFKKMFRDFCMERDFQESIQTL